jgi:hypothetical protein
MTEPGYHTWVRQNDREKEQRLEAEVAKALEPAGAAWAQLLLDCYAADLQAGYDAFWAGPSWFLEELGPPLLNEAGARFEAELWIAQIAQGMRVNPQSVWADREAAPAVSPTFDLLHPVWGQWNTGYCDYRLLGSDQRAVTHLMNLAERDHRHYKLEIDARCLKAVFYKLLGRGTHTPDPKLFRAPEAPVPERNPKLSLWEDREYWAAKYPPEVIFPMNGDELISQRWTSMLMPLLAPEFVREKSLSRPRSTAYVLPSDGDWVWALVADTVAKLNESRPELALLWRTGKKNNHGVVIWQPPVGDWIEDYQASLLLHRAARGIEVHMTWLVRHFKRLIRFYEPLLIPFFATRGETLLPAAFKE